MDPLLFGVDESLDQMFNPDQQFGASLSHIFTQRQLFLTNLHNSTGCTYICLWSFRDGMCRHLEGRYFGNDNRVANEFDTYRLVDAPSVHIDANRDRIPFLAMVDRSVSREIPSGEFEIRVSSAAQLGFYRQAGIHDIILMACVRGVVELGIPYAREGDVQSFIKNVVVNALISIPDRATGSRGVSDDDDAFYIEHFDLLPVEHEGLGSTSQNSKKAAARQKAKERRSIQKEMFGTLLGKVQKDGAKRSRASILERAISRINELESQLKDLTERSQLGDATTGGPDRSIHERRASRRFEPYNAPQLGALVPFDPTFQPSTSHVVPSRIEDQLTIEIRFDLVRAEMGRNSLEINMRARIVRGEIGVPRLFERLFDRLREENGVVLVSRIQVQDTQGPSYLNEFQFRLMCGGEFEYAHLKNGVRNVVTGLGAICEMQEFESFV